MVSKHIGFSESIVFRELEKIAQRTNLVTNEPVIQKTASIVDEDEVVMLETSGNLFVDSMRLAEELRNRGFEKQASSLEEKAVILKRAMSESGSDSLYDFWKETGESVVNFAHKTTNVDVAGYKPKNVNEVKKVVENSVRTAPTGDVNKALKMAGKVGELLKKYADGVVGQSTGNSISRSVNNSVLLKTEVIRNSYNNTYGLNKTYVNIKKLQELQYLDDNFKYTNNAPELKSEATSNINQINNLKFLGQRISDVIQRLTNLNSIFQYLINPNKAKSFFGDLKNGISSDKQPYVKYFNFKAVNPGTWSTDDWDDADYDKPSIDEGKLSTVKPEENEYIITGLSQEGKEQLDYIKETFSEKVFGDMINKYAKGYLEFIDDFAARIKNIQTIKNNSIYCKNKLIELQKKVNNTSIKNNISELNETIEGYNNIIGKGLDISQMEELIEQHGITIETLNTLKKDIEALNAK